jgi:hypothetical protein
MKNDITTSVIVLTKFSFERRGVYLLLPIRWAKN